MTMIFVVVLFFVAASALAISTNSDIFSPAKIFLFLFMAFHVGAVLSGTTASAASLILLVVVVGVMAVIVEAVEVDRLRRLRFRAKQIAKMEVPRNASTSALFLWLASLPAIFAQIYMIQQFGGFEGYVNNLGFRVVEWAGLGWAVTLTGLMGPLSVAYFAVGIRSRHTRRWWLLFATHFLIFVGMGLLSGSRGGLLVVLVLQAIAYHYIRGPVKGSQAALLASALTITAMALGTLRNTSKFEHGRFTTGNAVIDNVFNTNAFYYGVQPLEVISEAPYLPLANGSTFLSIITNVVPRTLWPEKPDTGGAFFTQYYSADAWGGYSNLTPTFLGEWIINFGWEFGIAGFMISYLLLMVWLVKFYVRSIIKLKSNLSDVAVIDFVIYIHVAWAGAALMVGEITNVVLGVAVSAVLPLLLIRFLVNMFGEREHTTMVLGSATVH